MGLFAVGTPLAAGVFRLAGSDDAAVIGVIPSGRQEIAPAVVAAAGRVARHQPLVEISVEKVGEITKLHLFRQESFSCFRRMCHRDKAKLRGKALTEFLPRGKRFPRG